MLLLVTTLDIGLVLCSLLEQFGLHPKTFVIDYSGVRIIAFFNMQMVCAVEDRSNSEPEKLIFDCSS